jgi:hypothetical protein
MMKIVRVVLADARDPFATPGGFRMSMWSVTLTAVLDRSMTDHQAWQVATEVAARSATRLTAAVATDVTLAVVVRESRDELPDAAALFSAYERAVVSAGYAIVSWEAVELVTDTRRDRVASHDAAAHGPATEGPASRTG